MEEKKGGFGEFINAKVLPPIMKFVSTKPVTALKDGMVYALPFIIIGSIFLILSNFPIPAVSNALAASGWSAVFTQAYTTSFGLISIWASVGIAYVYFRHEGFEPLPAGLTSLSAFFLLQFLQVSSPLVAAMGKSGSTIGSMSGTQVAAQVDKLPQTIQNFLTSPVTGAINITWAGG